MIKNQTKEYVVVIYYYFIVALFFTVLFGQILLATTQFSPFISQYRIPVLVAHGLVYLFIYFNWPGLTLFLSKQAGVAMDETQRKKIISARNMLILLFISSELLFK